MNKLAISIDLRVVIVTLLLIICGMFAIWHPWQVGVKRTIDISGAATIKAEPNSYVFTPSYQKKGTDRTAIQTELRAQVTGVIAKLKELGVADSQIALSSSTYDNYYNDGSSEVTSNSLTITVDNKDLVQKVQDYLVTTNPEGQISPFGTFSTEKRKSLETEARVAAIKDALSKADSTAKELGLKIGKVVTISDPQSGTMYPMAAGSKGLSYATDVVSSAPALPVLGGKQEVSYTIQVTYELK